MSSAAASAAMRTIWEQHRGSVIERIDVVDRAIADLMADQLEEATRLEAEREAHKLAGSVGTFGFMRASELAHEIELALRAADRPGPDLVPMLSELVLGVRSELDEEVPPEELSGAATGSTAARLVLAVDDDAGLLARLTAEGASRSVRVIGAASLDDARAALERETFDLVLLDLSFHGDQDATMRLLSELATGSPGLPVLVLTASEAFVDRVEVARRGGRGFLSKAMSAGQAIEAAIGFLEREHADDIKIVAVDDDPAILAALKALLEPEGLSLTTISDPTQLWDVLEDVSPDLLLVDVDMPGVDGIELCQAVRNDQRWAGLPVVFLTARGDPQTVRTVFAAGADDYLTKPIVAAELTMRIRNRLERIQLYRALADTDPLTGVANRRKATEAIEQLARVARRHGQPLSLAQLDLDHFKQVNDRYGHDAGDAVLRRLGAVLRRVFRGEDVVARWGGEEFLVAMYGMSREDGVQRIAETLEMLRREDFGAEGIELPVTFSAGVAQFPDDGEDLRTLCRATDAALYVAKAGGRDRVLPVGHARGREDAVDVVLVEDDEVIADLLLHSLHTRGYSTRWLTQGDTAVAALTGATAELKGRVVLLDVDLPGLDGVSVLRRLAADAVLRRTRVIMLTARSAEDEVLRALELGAADHVSKPFSIPILMHKLRRALAEH
ncbi:MAG: response regulator [Solirubrobacteraceae bacterium]